METYSLHEPGVMTVRGHKPFGLVVAVLPVVAIAAFLLGGFVVGLGASVMSALAGILTVMASREVLEVRKNEVRYRQPAGFGGHGTSMPRSALVGVRVRYGGSETRTSVVDIVFVGPSLPAAVSAFESTDSGTAPTVGQQIAEHVNVPLLNEMNR